MLSDCRHASLRNLNSTDPVDVVRVKSYVDSLLNSTRIPVRVSVNKLNFVPDRIMTGLLCVFTNGRSLTSRKPYIPIVLLACTFLFRQYTLPHSQGISHTTPSCFRGSTGSLGRTAVVGNDEVVHINL